MVISWHVVKCNGNKNDKKEVIVLLKAIYKITNNINGRNYIGQSNNPKRRFQEHIRGDGSNSLIHLAILKYGVQNFSFEVLGWYEDYSNKEKQYIIQYNSLAPNGYNIMEGGEEPPIMFGENNPFSKITNEVANFIKLDLLNYSIPYKEIAKKYQTTRDIIRHINEGTSWHDNNLKYPLRPSEVLLNAYRAEKAIELLLFSNMSQKEIGKKLHMKRSYVTMINNGKNHRKSNLKYPLRQKQRL